MTQSVRPQAILNVTPHNTTVRSVGAFVHEFALGKHLSPMLSSSGEKVAVAVMQLLLQVRRWSSVCPPVAFGLSCSTTVLELKVTHSAEPLSEAEMSALPVLLAEQDVYDAELPQTHIESTTDGRQELFFRLPFPS